MSLSLVPFAVARRATRLRTVIQQTRSMAGYWNRDWRPADDVPKTEEGRRAAAKKYGLILEDYKTYEEDGTGYGDYPNLPMIGAESKDPHALYDMPELKRNYGEPLPVHADMIGEDRWNYGQRLRYPIYEQLATYVGVMSALAVLFYIGEHVRIAAVPMMPKQLLYEGKKHYSFELD